MVVVISQMGQVGIAVDRFQCHPERALTCIRRPNGHFIPRSFPRAAGNRAPGPYTATHCDSSRDPAVSLQKLATPRPYRMTIKTKGKI